MCNLLEEKDVTPVNLSIRLEHAVIQHRLQDDGGIYVTEDGFYPHWIRVNKDRAILGLTTYTYFKKDVSREQKLEFCNSFNSDYFFIAAFVEDEKKLKVEHFLSFREGILVENFIRTVRNYSKSINSAMSDYNKKNEICCDPGDTDEDEEDVESD